VSSLALALSPLPSCTSRSSFFSPLANAASFVARRFPVASCVDRDYRFG
jgi:hypothetical protein